MRDGPAPRPQAGVGVIAIASDRLLLVRRARERGSADVWAVPGGRIEPGERVREAVVRELREETGLRAECGEFVGWAERLAGDAHYVILDFRVRLLDPAERARAGDDADAVAWVPLEDVATWPLVEGLADFLVAHGVVGSTTP